MKRCHALLTLVLLGSTVTGAQAPAQRWYRGNTHTHTLNSDGDTPPAEVVRWYRTHGYQFLFITDHEYVTDVAPLNQLYGTPARFLTISGQEITQLTVDPKHPEGIRQVHVNALGTSSVIRPLGERNRANQSIASTYTRNIAEVRRGGGVAQVNHPNWRWSVTVADMADLPDSTLLEVWNGHPDVHNLGGTDSTGNTFPSHEAAWDSLLSRGRVIWGVADDDSHHFKPEDADNPDLTRSGRGWVMVRADTLTRDAIVNALRRGEFYSSTGVALRAYSASRSDISLEITPRVDTRYRIEFVGKGGRVLSTVHGIRARYAPKPEDGYVRVRINDSGGRRAWTQAVIVR